MRRGRGFSSLPAVAVGLGALVLSVPGLACGGGDEPAVEAPAPPANEVEAADFAFEPEGTEVEPGTEVTWVNTGKTIHNVKGRGFFSDAIDPGEDYSFRFKKAGTYEYVCTLHPETMRGTVEVVG